MKSAFIGSLLQTGCNVLIYAFLVRFLPSDVMRIWVLFITLITFADLARQGLVHNGTVRQWAIEPENQPRIASASLILAIVAAVVSALLVFALAIPLSNIWQAQELIVLALGYLVFAPFWALLKWLETIQIAKENFSVLSWSGLPYGALVLIGIYYLHAIDKLQLVNIIGLQTLAAILTTVLLLFRFGLPSRLRLDCLTQLKTLFAFGKYSAGTSLFSMLFNKADLLILGALLPGPAIVLYDVASRLYNYLDLPLNSLAQVFYPKLSYAIGQNDKSAVNAIFEQAIAKLAFIMVPIAMVTFIAAPYFVYFMAGSGYAEAAPLLQILVVATVIKPWGRMGGITMDALGVPAVNFVILVVSALINVVTNYIFISCWGVYGAAIATVVSVWVTIIIGQVWLCYRIQTQQKNILTLFIRNVKFIL